MGEVPVIAFTKEELRLISEHMASLRPPGPRPLNAEQLVKVNSVIEKTHHIIATTRAMPERGDLVFEWRVPRELALTLNAYAQKKGWQKKKIRQDLDAAITALLHRFPKALMFGSQRPRWLRATRFSTKVVDDVSVDVVGGKMPTDALVRCGVLADDDPKHLIREARMERTKPGNTHLLVQVWNVVSEGRSPEEPVDVSVQQIEREPGFFTKAIMGGER